MKKKWMVLSLALSVLFILFLFFLYNGSTMDSHIMREYGLGYINEKFAQNLKTCQKYTTPTYYAVTDRTFSSGNLIPYFSKHKTKIIGQKDQNCIIRRYDSSLFSLSYEQIEELTVPKDFAVNISDMLQQAFRENINEEETAKQMAVQFCKDNEIRECLLKQHFSIEDYSFEEYLTDIIQFVRGYNPQDAEKMKALKNRRAQDKKRCKDLKEQLATAIKNAPDMSSLSDWEIEGVICKEIFGKQYYPSNYWIEDETDFFRCYAVKSGIYLYRETKKISLCRLKADLAGNVESYYWQENINTLVKEM